jgi:hypothetical protein
MAPWSFRELQTFRRTFFMAPAASPGLKAS